MKNKILIQLELLLVAFLTIGFTECSSLRTVKSLSDIEVVDKFMLLKIYCESYYSNHIERCDTDKNINKDKCKYLRKKHRNLRMEIANSLVSLHGDDCCQGIVILCKTVKKIEDYQPVYSRNIKNKKRSGEEFGVFLAYFAELACSSENKEFYLLIKYLLQSHFFKDEFGLKNAMCCYAFFCLRSPNVVNYLCNKHGVNVKTCDQTGRNALTLLKEKYGEDIEKIENKDLKKYIEFLEIYAKRPDSRPASSLSHNLKSAPSSMGSEAACRSVSFSNAEIVFYDEETSLLASVPSVCLTDMSSSVNLLTNFSKASIDEIGEDEFSLEGS
ncbi:MAG: hypothetical protein UR26_C0002G0021 [candidate division TM6 bacterium GW2011_GWF2_32_72]|nr:MAG: hypothetical protein UR26_C0002G0021 [candidate division TM6 bacterium GW2011_GWF2_32_72]